MTKEINSSERNGRGILLSIVSPVAVESALAISATTGEGIDRLLDLLGAQLRNDSRVVTVSVPFAVTE